jgi:hypothetical protein
LGINNNISSTERSESSEGLRFRLVNEEEKRYQDQERVHTQNEAQNVHVEQQEFTVNFFENFAPFVNWFSARLIFTLALLSGWSTNRVDFVLSYHRDPIEFDMYINFPKGYRWQVGT